MGGYEEYAGLGDSGFENNEPVAPEDEFFHALYIAGKTRKNHIDVEEIANKLQIRGLEYNLDKVNMIITHVKKILVNSFKDAKTNKDKVQCFSFKKDMNPPWFGTTMVDGKPRQCGSNSGERANDSFCNTCREQIVVGGIYCDDEGHPILTAEKKPQFMFLRGKGMKYSNVSTYLGDCFKEDYDPIFEPVTAESRQFEKKVVNNKRYVTTITKGIASSQHGDKDVFILEKGVKIGNQEVISILKIANQTKTQFNEKIDWSQRMSNSVPTYSPDSQVDDSNKIPDSAKDQKTTTQQKEEKKLEPTFSFEDIEF